MSHAKAGLGRLPRIGAGLVRLSLWTAAILPLSSLQAGDYRGMAAGWPVYANGAYPAGQVPVRAISGPVYYVARPAMSAAPGRPPGGVLYAPVRLAYANPQYFAAYGKTASAPVTTVGYAPGYAPGYAAGYAPGYAAAAGYATPTSVNYAPANAYAVTPAGMAGGSEGMAYYGQSTSLNYVPPRFAYRTTYAAVPVYAYQPVTAYNPVAGQPVTCLQPATTSTCQPQRQSCSTWWNPFTWFRSGSSCRGSGCGGPPPATTAYCCGSSSCSQPYYPVQPMTPTIPSVPAPAVTTPSFPMNVIPALPSGTVPRATPTIPPMPTRTPGAFGTLAPADQSPRLAPGTITTTPAPGATFSTPAPGGIFTAPPATAPGGITPLPSGPATPPGGSFQTTPAPSGGVGTGGFGAGTFGTSANYPPASDVDSQMNPATSATPPATSPAAPSKSGAPVNERTSEPAHSVFGSGYRSNSPSGDNHRQPVDSSGTIRAPELRPALPPSVHTVPDLDAPVVPPTNNRAPQLLSPRDKTAANGNSKWAVVPAVWPASPAAESRQLSERPVVATKAFTPAAGPNLAEYDDGGWKSAR